MLLNVKWGKERISYDVQDPSVPLGQLRKQISEWSHLPPSSFKLISSGAVMKDDHASLSAYRLRPNSTIQVVGSAEPVPAPAASSAQESESSTIAQIHDQLANVRSNLVPSLQTFLQTLPTTLNPHPSLPLPSDPTPNSNKNLSPIEKEHARLGELLLQSLLKLDATVADRDWERARQERKAAVKEVQGYLDQLDDAWTSRIK